MAFGDVNVGQVATRTLTISNTGSRSLNVTGISYPTGFSGNWNGGSIAAGATRNVTVTFEPTSLQHYSGDINVASDATSGMNTQGVSARGLWSGIDPTAIYAIAISDRWIKNFYVNGHETMGDRITGLLWVYNASAAGQTGPIAFNFTYAGHSNWALPNLNQLQFIYSQKALFAGVQNNLYWSSTRDTGVPNGFCVDMRNGNVHSVPMVQQHWAWPVRSGL